MPGRFRNWYFTVKEETEQPRIGFSTNMSSNTHIQSSITIHHCHSNPLIRGTFHHPQIGCPRRRFPLYLLGKRRRINKRHVIPLTYMATPHPRCTPPPVGGCDKCSRRPMALQLQHSV
ncbi:unnamed protein product [Larinioides sclopetarius]|uniref:Uncharacterized protein n=1 Tax=Larinioides sclopetarius TaxID=280406 RepID=A0AAV2B906_9ARAC